MFVLFLLVCLTCVVYRCPLCGGKWLWSPAPARASAPGRASCSPDWELCWLWMAATWTTCTKWPSSALRLGRRRYTVTSHERVKTFSFYGGKKEQAACGMRELNEPGHRSHVKAEPVSHRKRQQAPSRVHVGSSPSYFCFVLLFVVVNYSNFHCCVTT